jgi:AcrR family transcriptional regulator
MSQAPEGAAKPKRARRSAEEARREILDATEERLSQLGPDGIRLQQIASDLGVSHPAILHHFGSREGLMRAVVERAFDRLETDLIAALQAMPTGDPVDAAVDVVKLAFRVLVDKGHARVVAWLLLSGQPFAPKENRLGQIAEVTHARRLLFRGPDAPPITLEDTVFQMLLVAFTTFGEAIAGPLMRANVGLDDAGAPDRFREWLARLIVARNH